MDGKISGSGLIREGVVGLATKILSKYTLCDTCLGRQFSTLAPGIPNRSKGFSVKLAIMMEAQSKALSGDSSAKDLIRVLAGKGRFQPAKRLVEDLADQEAYKCYVCEDKITDDRILSVSDAVSERLKDYEFKTFLVGAIVPAPMRERDDAIRAEFNVQTGEDIKNDINREVSRILQSRFNAKPEFFSPDLTILVDVFRGAYSIQPNPVFVKGYYRKMSRNIPQAPWLCSVCKGSGCDACGYTGRKYEKSVSELIGLPSLKLFEALDYKFHAAGREDVDATVAGSGRPFVLEIKRPRKRYVDLRSLEKEVNDNAGGLVEVSCLSYSSKKEVRLLKSLSSKAAKTYVATVTLDAPVEGEKLKELEEAFINRVVEQATPTRVLRRRADKIRKKMVYYVKTAVKEPTVLELEIKVQGGLYVKELITGDNGRTNPSIASVLGRSPLSILLSVTGVEEV